MLKTVLVLALVAGLGYVGYVKLGGGAQAAHVKVLQAPSPKEVVRAFAGSAKVAKSQTTSLSFGESGKVVDVVAVGTEAKPGMVLASLDSLAAIEKELNDVKDREAYYQAELKKAQEKNKASDIKKAEEKVAEKRKRITELEARQKKVRLVSPTGGTVAEVVVAAGATANANEPVVRLADKRLITEFKLSLSDAASLKPLSATMVAPEAGGPTAAARVLSASGGVVKVEVLDDAGGAIKSGDNVVLVRSRLSNVMRLPSSAVSKSQGGADQVFVVVDGSLHARPVTLAPERTPAEVYVTSGLTPNELVVVTPGQFVDGQKAITE